MSSSIKIILICLWSLSAVACSNAPSEAPAATGVWADADCELLRTQEFALLFDRCDTLLTASLSRLGPDGATLVGKAVFGPGCVVERYVAAAGQPATQTDAGTLLSDGTLRITTGGRERTLTPIERFTVVEPYEMLRPSPLEIGSCLQQWNLGTRFDGADERIAFEAGTNRHSYVFYLQPGMDYCRAARLRFDERGGLFAQNIRLMASARSGEHTARMAPDNRAESAAPLTIDDAKFSPDRCVFDRDGIYWSFLGFDGDTALINGCGKTDRFARPALDAATLSEWIAFEKY